MDDMIDDAKVLRLITLFHADLLHQKIGEESHEYKDISIKARKRINKAIEELSKIYFAGPSGYDPEPVYEKCDQCDYYRIKK